MGTPRSGVLIVFALLILIHHQDVTSRRLGPHPPLDSSPQDASSPSSWPLASQKLPPDLNRTTAHVRPTSAPTSNHSTHRGDRATVAAASVADALNIKAAHNSSSQVVAVDASRQQASSNVASISTSTSPPAGSLAGARVKWRQMEQALAGAHTVASMELKRTLDELWLALAQQDRQISGACKHSLDELALALGQQEVWASQMFDASAGHRRLPSGLLEGTLTELGNFDECLAISGAGNGPAKGKLLRGQYCSVLIKPPLATRPRLHTICRRLPSLSATMRSPSAINNNSSLRQLAQHSHLFYYAGLRLGLCLPSACTQIDVHHLLQAYLDKYKLVGQVKHCQREPAAFDERQANYSTTKLLDMPLVWSISQNFDLTQQCILWLDASDQSQRPNKTTSTSTIFMGGMMSNKLQSPPPVEAASELRSLASKRARQYRVCHGSNSTSCRSGDHPAGSSDDDLARVEQNGAERLGLQKNPLAESSVAQIHLNTGREQQQQQPPPPVDTQRVETATLSVACVPGVNKQLPRVFAIADIESANRMETLPLFLEREREQLIGAACSKSKSHLRDFLICFSLKRNIRSIGKLTTTTTTPADNHHQRQTTDAAGDSASSMTDLKVVHGLRTLSMIWIIFGHTAILNTTLAVDTFFMLSGLVTVISFVRKCKSARHLIERGAVTVAVASATVWPPGVVGASSGAADIEVSSVDSSSSAITSMSSSASSSNRCIRPASKSSSQKNFIVNKTLGRPASDANGWPNDFRPLAWLLLRYLRLTPAYASVIGLSILLPSLGSGPFWPETVGQLGATCRVNWWTNLLYVNNFIETDKLCLIHSWYLSNDWQFFLLALLLIGVFYKSRKLALILLVGAFVASSATTFILTLEHDYPPTIVATSPALAERWQYIYSLYYKPWSHMPAYLIGLIVGYALLKLQYSNKRQLSVGGGVSYPLHSTRPSSSNTKLNLTPRLRLLCWLLFGMISFAVLNSVYPWNMGLQVDPIITALHAATFRSLWASCCAWLVFALVSRPRHPLGLLLSWHGFQMISRLTYCVYLVHPLVIYYHFGTIRERIDSSPYGQLHRFLATLIMSYLVAFVVALLVESPSIQVQKLVLNKLVINSKRDKLDDDADDDDHDNDGKLDERQFRRNPNESHLAGGQKKDAAPTNGRRKSSPGRVILSQNCFNSNSSGEYTRQDDCSYENDVCSKSILFAPSARLRANLSTKLPGEEEEEDQSPGFIGDTNLASGKCPHASPGLARSGCPTFGGRDAHELSDGGCSSSSSNHSAIDEEFQKKLAQAIGRGFMIRSRIVNGTLEEQCSGAARGHGTRKRVIQVESPIRLWPPGMPAECANGGGGDLSELSGRGSRQELELTQDKPGILSINRRESASLASFLGTNKQVQI